MMGLVVIARVTVTPNFALTELRESTPLLGF